MDTTFAKIVTDPHGRDHILIEGRVISLDAPLDENNRLVDTIVRGLRSTLRAPNAVVQGHSSVSAVVSGTAMKEGMPGG